MKIMTGVKSPTLLFVLAAIILSAAFFVIKPNLFRGGIPGSFEYVRKADELLDKGKHAAAIKYYEKAHEASPESDTIRDNLVYAYSIYAVTLSDSEKYDMAIEYLSKAYDIVRNSYTRQNLALMHARRSVFGARKSDWAGAQVDLDAAREIADDSVICCRNLGISLFNDAVAEFKAGREDAAILLAREAALVYGDSRIYEFLGDIYYKRVDLESARFYLDKAARLDPGNVALAEKLEKVLRQEAISGDERTMALPYFDLRYNKDLPVNAELTGRILEKAYFDVGKDLSYFPGTKTVVLFYSEKDFREIFKMRDLVRAFYDGNIRMPLPDSLSDEKEIPSYIYHEYTHAIVSAKTNNNCPVWLNEGMAVYEEFKWTRTPGALSAMAEGLDGRLDISIRSIDEVFKDPSAESSKLRLAYMLACTAVEYMVDGWGMKALDRVLAAIAEGRHAVNAIDDEYLLSEKEFNKRWSDFVMKRYGKK